MKFPLYGKQNHVPNHQPDKIIHEIPSHVCHGYFLWDPHPQRFRCSSAMGFCRSASKSFNVAFFGNTWCDGENFSRQRFLMQLDRFSNLCGKGLVQRYVMFGLCLVSLFFSIRVHDYDLHGRCGNTNKGRGPCW